MREISKQQEIHENAIVAFEYMQWYVNGASVIPYDDRQSIADIKNTAQQIVLSCSLFKGMDSMRQDFVWFPDIQIASDKAIILPYIHGKSPEEYAGTWYGIQRMLMEYGLTRVVIGNRLRIRENGDENASGYAYVLKILDCEGSWRRSDRIKFHHDRTFTVEEEFRPWEPMADDPVVEIILSRCRCWI